MLSHRHFYRHVLALVWLWAATVCCHAFALLGPYEPWMDRTNGFRIYDIGGPMELNSEYRWNVPVVTYGFDQSFRDYFGSNGVAAVEAAIQVLNNLPPAADLVLSNFPTNAEAANYPAQAQGLYDLKSVALSLLVEQMGLAAPHQGIFVLKKWDSGFHFEDTIYFNAEYYWSSWAYPDYILQRNYDPATWASTHSVNEVLFSAYIGWYVWLPNPNDAEVRFFQVDPIANFNRAVADNIIDYPYINDHARAGKFWQKGLTRDDAGGLRYLLNAANTNEETLLPGIYGTGANAGNFVNAAVRPGLEKITFVPQPQDGNGGFLPVTNEYVDTYIANGTMNNQTLARVTVQPDILFTASNLGLNLYERTGTSNWINNAALNGQPSGAGPGVICPPIRITFNRAGTFIYEYSDPLDPANQVIYTNTWGSFADTTNPPVVYPAADSQPRTTAVTLIMEHYSPIPENNKVFNYQLNLTTPAGTAYWVQTSTNLLHWDNVAGFTNDGYNFTFEYGIPDSISARFFRIQPQ